jgi:membrane protease YdiL (CAAX protease family)
MRVGPIGISHLVLFGALLPWAAFRFSRNFATRPLPPRPRLFVSVIVQQALFAILSLWVARLEHINLFPHWELRPLALMAGAGLLAGGIAILGPQWREDVERRERRLHICMPRTTAEHRLWVGVSVAAGFAEEVTYRGVMFVLLSRLLDGPLAAALVASAVFGFSHIIQGWKSAGIIGVMALVLQGLVLLSGSLYIVMAVHAIYDIVAGFSYGRLGERLGYPREGIELAPEVPAQPSTPRSPPSRPADAPPEEG